MQVANRVTEYDVGDFDGRDIVNNTIMTLDTILQFSHLTQALVAALQFLLLMPVLPPLKLFSRLVAPHFLLERTCTIFSIKRDGRYILRVASNRRS